MYNRLMTENFEHTQPTQIETGQPSPMETTQPRELQKDDTQPIKPIKKPSRWRAFLIGLLGLTLLIGLGGFGGYATAINERQNAEDSLITAQLMEQYQLALVDIQFGRYEAARQRLDFIIKNEPTFPGVQEKLTEVMVMSSIPTATVTPTLTATPDFSGAESAFLRAQQLVNAQDWVNALSALDIIRKLDATYKTAQVDGMYYFALRNLGNDLILKHGNLEGGIYHLTLAERFGQLDNTSIQLRESARLYIIGASFWELDWRQAIAYFSQVGSNVWDGDMTAGERLNTAYIKYGDYFFEQQNFCEAYDQYSGATTLDERATWRLTKSTAECYPPTEAPVIDVPVATEAPVTP